MLFMFVLPKISINITNFEFKKFLNAKTKLIIYLVINETANF